MTDVAVSTLAGHRITSARLYLGAWGVGWLEASLDEETKLTGRVTASIGGLSFTGTVMSGGPGPIGRSSYRIAGGAGGWGRTITANSYANDAGVKASTVLQDAASACGETIDPSTFPSTVLGPSWTRDEGPASRTLERLAPSGWYVGEDGTTRIGRRPAVTLSLPVPNVSADLARGVVELAVDSLAGLVPGAVVGGLEAVDVLHELGPKTLRTTLWGAGIAPTSRRLTALRRIFEQLDPLRRFRGTYEYRVVTQEGERLNLQPVRVSVGMPDLQRVTVRPGVSGARADVALGSRVLVTFVDADPARPAVVGFEDAEGAGFQPGSLSLGAAEAVPDVASASVGRFIRYGDPMVTFPGGVATPGVALAAPAPAPGSLSTVRSG